MNLHTVSGNWYLVQETEHCLCPWSPPHDPFDSHYPDFKHQGVINLVCCWALCKWNYPCALIVWLPFAQYYVCVYPYRVCSLVHPHCWRPGFIKCGPIDILDGIILYYGGALLCLEACLLESLTSTHEVPVVPLSYDNLKCPLAQWGVAGSGWELLQYSIPLCEYATI